MIEVFKIEIFMREISAYIKRYIINSREEKKGGGKRGEGGATLCPHTTTHKVSIFILFNKFNLIYFLFYCFNSKLLTHKNKICFSFWFGDLY